VQDAVDAPVPGAGEPVPGLAGGGGVQGRGAVPGGEPVAAREPVDAADGEQPGGTRGADAVQAQQGGSARGDQPGELLVDGLGRLVDRLELAGQFHGEPAAGLAGQVPRLDGGDQCAGLPGGQELLGPAGYQLQQQPVQPAADLGAGAAQLIAAVREHAHHHQVLLDPDLDQARAAQGNQRDSVRVDRIGLAKDGG